MTGQSNHCLELLYKRHRANVYHQCLSITKDADCAQDYTHDIFIKAFEKLISFQNRANFSTWLYTIARHYCLDQMRLNQRWQTEVLTQETEDELAEEGDNSWLQETLLNRAFSQLPVQSQRLLTQKYSQQLSIKAIALAQQSTIAAIKMRLMRNRTQLQQLYQDLLQST